LSYSLPSCHSRRMVDRDQEQRDDRAGIWQGRILIIAVVVLVALTIFGLLFVDTDVAVGG
jgi:hypothetical protein